MNRNFFRILLFSFIIISLGTSADAQNKRKRKKINRVITEAKAYLGTPYRYGGMSNSGIDCSGLIYNCYRTIDVKLPRTAKEQSKIGRKKGWGSIRPGDIVYFKFKKRGEKWYHTGMITYAKNGEIRFIHASSSRGVVESNLNSDYYRKNVKKFRRVIR